MKAINIIFFGSTSDSVIVAEKLFDLRPARHRCAQAQAGGFTIYDLRFCAVVTQPPKPVGRKQTITPTPVEIWAKEHTIPALSFPSHHQKPWLYENEEAVSDTLAPFKADLLISASFGQKIPQRSIHGAKYGGINVHPSLLPRWRGADPVPWAILAGDHQIGVTIVTVNEQFDEGKILAQHKIPMGNNELSDPLRTKLFALGADLLGTMLPDFLSGTLRGTTQDPKNACYARKFTRDDGFEPWELLLDPKEAIRIHRKFRALSPWPGLWTRPPSLRSRVSGQATIQEKRLKILSCHVSHDSLVILDTVQLEGKKPVSFQQFSLAYLSHTT